jgi:Protein of unknown function (DUF2971)
MNDPHVDRLHYSIGHSEGRDCTAARPQERKHPSFTVRIESGQATVTMIDHFATAEDARAIVEPFLRKLSSALLDWSGFEFVFQRADIIDRSPSPRSLDAQAEFHGIGGLSARAEVDAQALARTSDILQSIITRFVNAKRLTTPPGLLHHYTSLDSARKILEQDDVRLSHAEYSNDQMEMAQAKDVIGEVLNKAGQHSSFSAQVRKQYDAVAATLDAYVFCTSSGNKRSASPQDRLSQWRAYGQDGRGVCLSLVSKKLAALVYYTPGLRINPVIYDPALQVSFVEAILAEGEALDKTDPLALAATLGALVFATPMMKAHGFSEEQEWRLIFMPPAADLKLKLEFHPRRDFLAPFLTLKYIWNDLRPQLTKIITINPPLNVSEPTGEPLLPVAEVMVGPSGNQPLNERAMMKLLAQTPWPLEPKRSCIPYRSIQ